MPTPTSPHRPLETDRICDFCGYSLIGLVENRCPECGRAFDPNGEALPGIPWLLRKQIGNWHAYWRTVAMVWLRPEEFARHVRRSRLPTIADAEAFRRTITWQFTIALMVFTMLAFVSTANRAFSAWVDWTPYVPAWMLIAYLFAQSLCALSTTGVRNLLASVDPLRYRLLYEYSYAALCVTPLVAILWGVAWMSFVGGGGTSPPDMLMASVLPIAVVALWWYIVILRLVPHASNDPARTRIELALALPARWLAWFVLSILVAGFAAAVVLPFAALVSR